MAEESMVFSQEMQPVDWNADDQNLLSATLMATPTQRIAWLEESLQLAYVSGGLKLRRFISEEEWDVMGSSPG
ncbi:MAG: hypothetical protein AB7P24_05490 [Nitrospira sp.]